MKHRFRRTNRAGGSFLIFLVVLTVFVMCTPAPGPAATDIGDFAWNDLNQNGLQDNGEPGLPSVHVDLLNVETMDVLSTTTTNASGAYLFSGLHEDVLYILRFTLLPGYVFSPMYQGSDRALDSDANPAGLAGMADIGVVGQVLSIDAGMYAVPLPPSILLLGTGLLCLAAYRRRKLSIG